MHGLKMVVLFEFKKFSYLINTIYIYNITDTQSFQDVPNPLPVTSDDRGHTPQYMEIMTCHYNKLVFI